MKKPKEDPKDIGPPRVDQTMEDEKNNSFPNNLKAEDED